MGKAVTEIINVKPEFSITTNVITKEDLKEQINATLRTITEIVGQTLGPYGATTLVQDRSLEHTISKDGYSVLKQIMFKEDVPRTILDIVRTISQSQVRSVGDGSTSSVIVAYHLYNSLFYDDRYKDITQTEMTAILNFLRDELEKLIKENAVEITDENKFTVLSKIATISTNNDVKIGRFIADVFSKLGKYSFVDIKLGKKPEHTFELTKGFEVRRGIIDTVYVNQPDKKTSLLEDVLTIHIQGKLTKATTLKYVIPALEKAQKDGKSLAIIANGYDHESKDLLRQIYIASEETGFLFSAIDMALSSPDAMDRFLDLEAYLGATAIDLNQIALKEFNTDCLGYCKEFISANGTTRFIAPANNEESVKRRKGEIQEKIDEIENVQQGIYDLDSVVTDLKRRYYALDQSIAVIYVGGSTITERETTQYLIEDAVYACKSAIDMGYIIGGNLTIPNVIFNEIKDITTNIFKRMVTEYKSDIDVQVIFNIIRDVADAFSQSFRTVLDKCYNSEKTDEILNECVSENKIFNLKTKAYETAETTDVINSAMTDIQIMYSCFSLIGLLGTSNQFLSTSLINK